MHCLYCLYTGALSISWCASKKINIINRFKAVNLWDILIVGSNVAALKDKNMCTLVGISKEQFEAIKTVLKRHEDQKPFDHKNWFEPVWVEHLCSERLKLKSKTKILITFDEILARLQALRDAGKEWNDSDSVIDEHCLSYLYNTEWFKQISGTYKTMLNIDDHKRYFRNFYYFLIEAELLK